MRLVPPEIELSDAHGELHRIQFVETGASREKIKRENENEDERGLDRYRAWPYRAVAEEYLVVGYSQHGRYYDLGSQWASRFVP